MMIVKDNSLICGWDSEWDNRNQEVIPISQQLYVLNDEKGYFLEGIGQSINFREIIEFLYQRYPCDFITLVGHFVIAEIMGLKDGKNIIFTRGKGQGFLYINKTVIGNLDFEINGENIAVEILDTWLLSNSSLEKLGELINLPKIKNKYRETGEMLKFYRENPEAFKQYAMRDAEITAKFYGKFFETIQNLKLENGKTIGAVFEKTLYKLLFKRNACQYLPYQKIRYRKKGKYCQKIFPAKYTKNFIDCYYGGKNEVYIYGKYQGNISHYDLISAYPTVLSLIPRWKETPKIFTDSDECYKFLQRNPLSAGYIEINFKFNDNILYPSIPIKISDGLIFPKQGMSIITAQEFLTSYPHLKRAEILAHIYPSIEIPNVISEFTSYLNEQRQQAQNEGNRLKETLLKLVASSGYGKFLQGYSEKRTLDLKTSSPEHLISKPIPKSKIANPLIASFITGFVRAIIAEYLFYFQKKNIIVASVTTDSFSLIDYQLTEDEKRSVGILSRLLSRKSLKAILNVKNEGEGLICIKTRGYGMIEGDNPLIALTGISLKGKSGKEKTAFLQKEFESLYEFKDTCYPLSRLIGLREWIESGLRGNITESKSYNYDYDLKRKPCNCLDGKRAKYHTLPFKDIKEYAFYKESYQNFKRGKRQNGKQIGTKNKLITSELVTKFKKYIQIKKSAPEFLKRINDQSGLRLKAIELHNKHHSSYEIAKTLNIPRSTVRYWLKTLKGGE